MRTLVTALVTALPLLAQTFVVDANNGPGTNFTTIAAAVASVPSGSVLLVRPGAYWAFTIASKSLTLIADPGAGIQLGGFLPSTVTIGPLAAGQTVALRGFWVSGASYHSSTPIYVDVVGCQGTVYLDDLRPTGAVQMTVSNCAAVVVRGSGTSLQAWSQAPLVATNSNVVLEDCLFYPFNGVPASISHQGTGSVQVSDSALYTSAVTPAITLGGGELRLLRGTTIIGGNPAVSGTGTVRRDAGVVMGSAIAPSLTVVNAPMPSLDASSSGPGLSAALRAPPGHLAAIAIALPGRPVALPGLLDAIWLDPATFTGVALGVIPASGSFSASLPLGTVPQAFVVAWQGHTYDPVAGILISNPSLRVVR